MRNLVIVILLIICLGLVSALIYSQFFQQRNQSPTVENSQGEVGLSKEEVVDLAMKYINETLLQSQAEAKRSGDIEEEGGLYKFQIEIEGQKFFTYVTKDGKLFFPQAFNLIENPGGEKTTAKNCDEVLKEDKPLLEAYVVSYCPYGLQMQRILSEIVKEIPQLKDYIKIRYLGAIVDEKITAMHGEEEAKENLTQICLRQEQADKFFSYLSCFIKDGNRENCLTAANIDKGKLNSCENDKNKGLKYAKEDFDLAGTHKVTGSPTLFLNQGQISEFNFGGRTAEAVKKLLCCGFKSIPEQCAKTLSEKQAASGFSPAYSEGTTGSGSCE